MCARDWPGPAVAVFTCAYVGMLEALPLPWPLPERAVLGVRPHIWPLLLALQRRPAYHVAMVDQLRAWLFSVDGHDLESVGAPGEGPGPGISGQADHRAGHRGAQAGRAARRPGTAGTGHPGRAASPAPARPAAITEAYAASMQAQAAVITTLNEQIRIMEAKVRELFRRHPDAGVYLSQPGIGDITGARVLGEFDDAPGRYATAKARKNYAGTSPLTIESGKKRTVRARYIRNGHLIDALHAQALSSLTASPGTRAFYDELRSRDVGHDDAMRRAAGRLIGILHGCVKTGTQYDEATAWSHRDGTAHAA